MTEQDPQQPTPEQEARVRALLAQARHDEPTPDAVVARLDRVLADLTAAGPDTTQGPAVERAERPVHVVRLQDRRRRAAAMLVAAAAVIVGGVVVGQLVRHEGTSESTTAGAAQSDTLAPTSPSTPDGQELSGGAGSGNGVDQGAMPQAPQPQSGGAADRLDRAATVRPRRFDLDVRRVRERRTAAYDSPNLAQSGDLACAAGQWGEGRYVPVRYGRAPGFLVFRRPAGDSQVVDLFLCGADHATRTLTLPHS